MAKSMPLSSSGAVAFSPDDRGLRVTVSRDAPEGFGNFTHPEKVSQCLSFARSFRVGADRTDARRIGPFDA
jgi:hypothetical protein